MPHLTIQRALALLSLVGLLLLISPPSAFAPDPPLHALAPFEVMLENLKSPRYLTFDSQDALLVSEGGPDQILQIDPDRKVTVVIDRLEDPEGIAVDPAGVLFLAADRLRGKEGKRQKGVILRRDPKTQALSVVASEFKDPRGLAFDPHGTLVVSAKGRRGESDEGERDEKGALYAIESSGGVSLLVDGFKQPQGVLVVPDGSLLVAAERFGHGQAANEGSLFQVDPAGHVTTVIPRPLKDPFGVARDPLDGLYVTGTRAEGPDPEYGVIVKRRPDGQVVTFAHGLHKPRGLAFDSKGNLYVVEAGQKRIMKFLAPHPPTVDPTPPDFTNQATLVLYGTTEPNALLTVQGGSAPVTGFADSTGRFSLSVPLAKNQTNTLQLFATGASSDGLTSAPTSVTVIHDDLPPAVSITTPSAGGPRRGTIPFTATATDSSGIGLVTLKVDGTTFVASNMPPFTTSLDTTLLADGAHTLSAIVRDKAGNAAQTSLTLTTDNTPPVLAVSSPSDESTASTATPTLSLTYSDATSGVNVSTLQVTLDGFDLTSAFAVSATAATATLTTPLASGPHTLQVSLADQAGNLSTAMSHFTVSTSPDFALTVAPAIGTVVQGQTIHLTVGIVGVNNYANPISLTVAGLPGAAVVTLSPAQVVPNSASTLTVAMPETLSPNTYSFTVTGTGLVNGTLASRSATASLTILPRGITTLSGRVLTTEEVPLPNVTIRLGNLTTRTDGAGNFLLTDPPTGEQVVLIDGSTASAPAVSYPTIPVTVTIEPGQVTSLGFTPHLHAQPIGRTVPLIPGQAATITDPAIPGFIVEIPAGVTIIGWDGQPNTQIGMRVVPPDRSPLPPLDVPPGAVAGPIYMFYFGKVGGGTPTAPVPIIGPNDGHGLPGESVDLYFYDEAPDGSRPNAWAKYGTGTVSSDGTQIIPDIDPATGRPYGMPRFCCGGRRVVYPPQTRPPSTAAPNLPALGQGPSAGEPVDLASGLFVLQKTDLVLPGLFPIAFTRTYRTLDASPGPFGPGTSHTYEVFLQTLSSDALLLTLPGNSRALFARQPDGRYVNVTESALRGIIVTVSGTTRVLTFKDQTVWTFDGNGRLVNQRDRNGNTLTLTRDGQGRLTTLIDPASRQLIVTYNGTSLLVSTVTDPLGRTVRYTYDGAGRLVSVTDPAAGVTSYTYDTQGRLATITDPRGILFLRNEYNGEGRVSRQTQADGGVWNFAYTLTGGVVTETVVTDPQGHTTTSRFNTSGFLLGQTDALGQQTTFERELGTNLLLSTTDPLGRTARFTYDAQGNVTTITDSQGQVRTFTYEPSFNRLTKLTDPLGHTTQFSYDANGNLTTITDPLGHTTTLTYNPLGQPVTTIDPMGNVTRFEYDAVGNLVTITDPLGNSSTRTYDAASRLLTQTDPRGKTTTFAYDALNRLMQFVDARNGFTHFSYDGNGNLLTVTDALDQTITHTYDSMDRLASRTDPLGRTESFTYDPVGNLVSTTDRKGQTTAFTHDALNRRVRSSFADGSSATFASDVAGRLVQADDSADPHRPITLAYDVLDRLMTETTALGTVRYDYDTLGRRTQMQVNDLSPVSYTYDAASRLRAITQAPLNPVTIDYDTLGRRTTLTLPNGVSTEYQYDAASRLTALIYRNAAGMLGDLTYTYDPAGNRTGVGGAFARTLIPDPVPSATYDAANRQLTFGDKSMTYDANGNLTGITDPSGVTTFTWDAQDRLSAVSNGTNTVTFAYDALGRQVTRAVNGRATGFQYSATDTIREVQPDGEVTYLRGLGPDQTFLQGQQSGYLSDASNSTIALVGGTGVITQEYSYEPFGKTAGPSVEGNRYQYTGREREIEDLYYYRARYYHTGLGRFIQPDPLGLLAGSNFYTYVENSPTNFLDPSGLRTYVVHGTWSSPSQFETFRNALLPAEPDVRLIKWRGHLFGDTIPSTQVASSNLLSEMLQGLANEPLKPGEKLNLIGHSAGGIIVNNVANMLKARGIKASNLILMGSPQFSSVTNQPPPAGVSVTNFIGLFDPLASLFIGSGGQNVFAFTGIDPFTAHTSYTQNPTVIRTIQQVISLNPA